MLVAGMRQLLGGARSREQCHQAGLLGEVKAVWGADYEIGPDGKPFNRAIGPKHNQTENSINAYIARQTSNPAVPPEKGFDKHVERMRAEKAETDKRKAAEEASRAKAWSAEIMPEQRSNLTVAPGTNRPKRSPQQFGVAGAFSCWPQTDTPLRSCRPSAQADQTGGGLAPAGRGRSRA